jgi:hypothetical protein
MRVPLKIGLVLLLVAVSASSSWAVIETYLPGGATVRLKFTNWEVGTLYDTTGLTDLAEYTRGGAVYDLDTVPVSQKAITGTDPITGDPTYTGEDSWGIFKLIGIQSGSTDLWLSGQGGIEITGIFWGTKDESLIMSGAQQTLKGNGLHYAFFEDTALNFSEVAGPGARDDSSGKPYFATATDGTLIWTGSAVPGITAADGYDFLSYYTPGDPGEFDDGHGAFLGNLGTNAWGTGSLNDLLGFLPNGVQMSFDFDASSEDADNGWLLVSDDPVRAYVTPELSSAPLMLLGMLPIGVAWFRRRKA